MSQNGRYHDIPLRTHAHTHDPRRSTAGDASARQSRVSRATGRQSMPIPPDEEDDQYDDNQYDDQYDALPMAVPRSARRYTNAQGDEVYEQGNRRLVVTHGKPPRRFHWLWFVGLGMLATMLLWLVLALIVNWWTNYQLDTQYGHPRTWQTDEVVGHADSTMHPSHFIFLNLNTHVVVIELPGGEVSHARIYSGPPIIGDNPTSVPVTGEFKDVNGDGKVDMLVHVGDQIIVFLNDGTKFVPQAGGV